MSDNSTSLVRNPGKADSPTVRGSEGAGTTVLSRTDSFWQIFNLSAARTVMLPSANIKVGDVLYMENQATSFLLTVQSANGDVLDSSIAGNRVKFMALQDTPSTSAHWRVTRPNRILLKGDLGEYYASASGNGAQVNEWNVAGLVVGRLYKVDALIRFRSDSGTGTSTLRAIHNAADAVPGIVLVPFQAAGVDYQQQWTFNFTAAGTTLTFFNFAGNTSLRTRGGSRLIIEEINNSTVAFN